MNDVQKLALKIKKDLPSAKVKLDQPAQAAGIWWLDITMGVSMLHVAWSPKRGFGISSPDPDAYGEGHDEVFKDLKTAWKRLQHLLLSGERTFRNLAKGHSVR